MKKPNNSDLEGNVSYQHLRVNNLPTFLATVSVKLRIFTQQNRYIMPRMNNRVLAINQINTPQSSPKIQQYTNKYGDSISYACYGLGVANGRYYNVCKAVAKTGNLVKILKSMEAARNFINRERNEATVFAEVTGIISSFIKAS